MRPFDDAANGNKPFRKRERMRKKMSERKESERAIIRSQQDWTRFLANKESAFVW